MAWAVVAERLWLGDAASDMTTAYGSRVTVGENGVCLQGIQRVPVIERSPMGLQCRFTDR